MELKSGIDFSKLGEFILHQDLYLISPEPDVYCFQYLDKVYGFTVLGTKIKRKYTLVIDTQPDDEGNFKAEKDFWDWESSLIN